MLWPNSYTSRSKPGLWATRTATSCAWLFELPPVRRWHALAGEDPGLGDGEGVAEVLGRTVAVGLGLVAAVGIGLVVREADGIDVAVGEGCACGCGPHALTTTIPSASASAP